VDELTQKKIDLKNKIDADIKLSFQTNDELGRFWKAIVTNSTNTSNAAATTEKSDAAIEIKEAIRDLHLSLG